MGWAGAGAVFSLSPEGRTLKKRLVVRGLAAAVATVGTNLFVPRSNPTEYNTEIQRNKHAIDQWYLYLGKENPTYRAHTRPHQNIILTSLFFAVVPFVGHTYLFRSSSQNSRYRPVPCLCCAVPVTKTEIDTCRPPLRAPPAPIP